MCASDYLCVYVRPYVCCCRVHDLDGADRDGRQRT